MDHALDNHAGSINIGGRIVTNLRFADDIGDLAGSENELKELVDCLDQTASTYSMEINAEKTKIMTNNPNGIVKEIQVKGQRLEEVYSFKYLGVILSDEGSKLEVLARIAQTTAALGNLKYIWRDRMTSLGTKVKLIGRWSCLSSCMVARHGR